MKKYNVIKNILDSNLNNIEYGFKINNINQLNINNWDNFSDFYYLQSPEELVITKCGVCWDQVELERELLNKQNINCTTYFIYIDDKKYLPSHTFLTYEENDKIYWYEHSWNDEKGLHKYDSRDKLMDDIIYKFKESRKSEIKGDEPIYIYEYNKPKYNINCDEMYEYIINTQKKLNKYTR